MQVQPGDVVVIGTEGSWVLHESGTPACILNLNLYLARPGYNQKTNYGYCMNTRDDFAERYNVFTCPARESEWIHHDGYATRPTAGGGTHTIFGHLPPSPFDAAAASRL